MARVPHADHLHGVPRTSSTSAAAALIRSDKLAGFLARVPVQPAPQLAFLRAGQADDVVLVARRAAGSGQGSAARSRAGARRSRPARFRGSGPTRSVSRSRQNFSPHGQQHQRDAAQDRHGGQQRQPGLLPGSGAGHHHQHTGYHQRQAGGEPRPSRRPGPPWSCPPARPGGFRRAASRRWLHRRARRQRE